MNKTEFLQIIRNSIEQSLQSTLKEINQNGYEEYHSMLAYHMGWIGDGAGEKASGKRIRPSLLLLVTAANRADWQVALPSAVAVELVHNFSLIHDDIEDNSQYRRGRLTVWSKWGIAQGVNAGDAMFTLAHLAIQKLSESLPCEIVFQSSNLLLNTCLHLTKGQFLDIDFEQRSVVSIEDYWRMVEGKTAALFSACTQLGAIAAQCDPDVERHYQNFGKALGLAFQVVDDILGIWGDEAMTGKSTASDLCSGKKTLPVLLGLQNESAFASRWNRGSIQPQEAKDLANLLTEEGILEATQNEADRLTELALAELTSAQPEGLAGELLYDITNQLCQRQK
ncbi:MAG: polyprenyl synthetase family protein [Anaerolineales bacterium]